MDFERRGFAIPDKPGDEHSLFPVLPSVPVQVERSRPRGLPPAPLLGRPAHLLHGDPSRSVFAIPVLCICI